MNLMDILNRPFGAVLGFCYDFVGSYGLAIILFTLFIKVLLLPLGIKQKKSMVRQMEMRPKEEALRKKYAKDKEKQQAALLKLYEEEGYNPMSGCLPLLIQFPVIISLYQVINRPLTYILKLSHETLVNIDTALGMNILAKPGYQEIPLASAMAQNPDKIAGILPHNLPNLDFSFFGHSLADVPQYAVFNSLWFIPILAGVFALLSSMYSQKTMPAPTDAGAAGNATKSMMYIMPLFSVFICFSMPAGVGLYWAASSLLTIVQEYILNQFYKPQEAYKRALEESKLSNAKKKKLKAAQESSSQSDTVEELSSDSKDDSIELPTKDNDDSADD